MTPSSFFKEDSSADVSAMGKNVSSFAGIMGSAGVSVMEPLNADLYFAIFSFISLSSSLWSSSEATSLFSRFKFSSTAASVYSLIDDSLSEDSVPGVWRAFVSEASATGASSCFSRSPLIVSFSII